MPNELSPVQLAELADAVADHVANRIVAQSAPVDYYGLAEWLGVSVPHLERLKRAGAIPYIQAGSRILFDRAAVVAALTAQERGGDA